MRFPVFIYFIILCFSIYSCDSEKQDQEEDSVSLSKDSILLKLENKMLIEADRSILVKSYLLRMNETPDDRKKLSKYQDLFSFLFDNKMSLEFKMTSKELLELSKKLKDTQSIARTHFFIASNYRRENLIDSAFASYYNAAKFYGSISKLQEAGEAYLSMAILQKRIKDFSGSEASSIRAIEFFEESQVEDDSKDQIRYLASAYNNLGTVANEREQYDEAIDYYSTSLKYRRKIENNGPLEAGTYNNIGLVYAKKGDFYQAINWYNKGLKNENVFLKRPKTFARLLDNKAFAIYNADPLAEVDSLFLKSLDIRESISDISGLGRSYYHFAKYKADRKELEQAVSYAQNGLEKSKAAGDNKGVLESLELLSKISSSQDALQYAQEYIQLSDAIQKADRSYQDQFARVRYETDTLLSENIKATQSLRRLTTIFLFTIVLLLLAYIWRQRVATRKEEEYQRVQQNSTEEIYSLMLAQSAKLEEGKLLEKKRISEELHDNVLSKLFGIRISLDSVHDKSGPEVTEVRASYLKKLQEVTQEIRQISHDLNRDDFLREQLFPEVLDNLITDFSEHSKVAGSLTYHPNIQWDELTDSNKAHIYRIIQEALYNTQKHAQASRVVVSFEQTDLEWHVSIKDDGKGLEPKRMKRGIGLKNIASRSEKIGGNFYIVNAKPSGTIIQIKFPRKKT